MHLAKIPVALSQRSPDDRSPYQLDCMAQPGRDDQRWRLTPEPGGGEHWSPPRHAREVGDEWRGLATRDQANRAQGTTSLGEHEISSEFLDEALLCSSATSRHGYVLHSITLKFSAQGRGPTQGKR